MHIVYKGYLPCLSGKKEMGAIKPGDLVTRKSHNHDVVFKIVWIESGLAELKGINLRLEADAPLGDLLYANPQQIETLAHIRQKMVNIRVKTKSSLDKSRPQSWPGYIARSVFRHT
ncbi:MAG TPA: sporulation peptidase YabG [Desulfobacteria bacterium]|nr:sporulation peptidase YabG [Desulfobacteria bacterium]